VLLALRYELYERNEQWVEAATIPLIVGSTVLAIGGAGLLRWALPGLLYLSFILPLPPSFDSMLSGPLQTVATLGAVSVLQAVGTPVLADGNIIVIGTQQLEVAEACRGLSMLLAFAALITAMVILVKRPLWERAVLLVSIIPIALLCNITRIAATAIVYAKFNRKVETAHDYAGYAMMVLALGLVMLELKIMSWLVVEEETGGPQTLLRTSFGANPGPR
jgi:exosortase